MVFLRGRVGEEGGGVSIDYSRKGVKKTSLRKRRSFKPCSHKMLNMCRSSVCSFVRMNE